VHPGFNREPCCPAIAISQALVFCASVRCSIDHAVCSAANLRECYRLLRDTAASVWLLNNNYMREAFGRRTSK
jgi:hypothetical protein